MMWPARARRRAVAEGAVTGQRDMRGTRDVGGETGAHQLRRWDFSGDRRRKRESRMKPARQEKASGGRGRDRALALLSGMWEAKLEPISIL
ncbi:unnamed protein product [Prorocentrum cordatum]|uniref:Uncharacterized protein n=1 Tax=Prorocentrum cordatum TaxID=2364126 RepID=A0ABN9TI92_9DINO|nr:unnamed protein product [Polarella glacialis]